MRFAMILSFLLLFGPSPLPSCAGEAPTPTPDTDAVAAVQKVAAGAEVHGIGTGGPAIYSFDAKEVKSWTQFVELLRRGEGAAGRVWELLPKKTQEFAKDDNLVGKLDMINKPDDAARLQSGVAGTIRSLLRRSDFYTEKAFKDVPLDKNLKDLLALGNKRTYLQTLRMNRELLVFAFPDHITPVPANYHMVHVRVKAGKPVILVLASSTACQWQVEVEDGGEVVGIVLCGTEPQEVAGAKAPVVYRAGRDPYWKDRWGRGEEVIWTSRDRKDKSFAQLEAGVKKITGKSLTDFQGKDTAPKDGFVVKPSAK